MNADASQPPPILLSHSADGRCELHSPTALPQASAFLWNRRMMIQLSCRGHAVAQHLQPEPARYSHAPNLQAPGFMQPEQPSYAHHPGRFVYLRDEDDGSLCSLPYEPVRRAADAFTFSAGPANVSWQIQTAGLQWRWSVQLPLDEAAELWTLEVSNPGLRVRRISLYPCFTIGYMSWMNQGARHRAELGGIVARSITPYQRLQDYATVRTLKDCTVLLHERPPLAWECRQSQFEGEGGLHAPTALSLPRLAGGQADYETPIAVLQYGLTLAPGARDMLRFVFAPARDDREIAALRARLLGEAAFQRASVAVQTHLQAGRGVLQVSTPDADFDRFVNHWLARQVYYHGDVQRLSTDPQTRNFLQDAMGMSYLCPPRAREAFLLALSQQQASGAMPDGILLHPGATLKYINQVPHSDHCVWLPICLQAYLDESGDWALLDAPVTGTKDGATLTVRQRIDAALRWLLADRDQRQLSYIHQGDWCDPMNMVGPAGRGVSGWLSVALVHALRCWVNLCRQSGDADGIEAFERAAAQTAEAVQRHLWDGEWFARGITDDGISFGVSGDREGRIYLNPQSWALLADIATPAQRSSLLAAIEAQLQTPYGPQMLAPAYTAMREDIGRLTQKYPGSAENGSVYNHAAAFYLCSLYHIGEADRAWGVLRTMIPGPDVADLCQRGQLPVFIPNYYRGAWRQLPRTAGRSSQLFNTGTVSWVYRALIDGLFGLRGEPEGLSIAPQLPSHWPGARLQRLFRGAELAVEIRRRAAGQPSGVRVWLDGVEQAEARLRGLQPGQRYRVDVEIDA